MSGVRNIQIVQDIPKVEDEDALFIINWDLYERFELELQTIHPKIIYKNLSFKTIFPKRLCKSKIVSQITQNFMIFF